MRPFWNHRPPPNIGHYAICNAVIALALFAIVTSVVMMKLDLALTEDETLGPDEPMEIVDHLDLSN